jgi:hypothetical protein
LNECIILGERLNDLLPERSIIQNTVDDFVLENRIAQNTVFDKGYKRRGIDHLLGDVCLE